MQETAHEKLDRLIETFDTAMLVTTSLGGKPRARPMSIADHYEARQGANGIARCGHSTGSRTSALVGRLPGARDLPVEAD